MSNPAVSPVKAKSKKKPAKKKDEMVTSDALESQVAAFLALGNQIEEVPQGLSGMSDRPSKHIVISRK